MKAVNLLRNFSLIIVGGLVFSVGISAQETTAPTPTPEQIARQETTKDAPDKSKTDEPVKTVEPENKIEQPTGAPKTSAQTAETKVEDKTLTSEEAAVISYYNNYLSDYRLGPNGNARITARKISPFRRRRGFLTR